MNIKNLKSISASSLTLVVSITFANELKYSTVKLEVPPSFVNKTITQKSGAEMLIIWNPKDSSSNIGLKTHKISENKLTTLSVRLQDKWKLSKLPTVEVKKIGQGKFSFCSIKLKDREVISGYLLDKGLNVFIELVQRLPLTKNGVSKEEFWQIVKSVKYLK